MYVHVCIYTHTSLYICIIGIREREREREREGGGRDERGGKERLQAITTFTTINY